MAKYIFVVGGVMSGVGKGIAVASIGKILQAKGFKVSAIKIDPYINVDAGTMNPTEHGEVFVTEDGDETDQDIGNYERFLDINFSSENYMTTGRIYQAVIEKERNLEYKGRCVEVVPHIPLEVIERIKKATKNTGADFMIIEIGGTIGEYQNLLFLEAARMMKLEHKNDVLFVLVSYLPIPAKIGEMKTKPTQYAIRTLNSAGIQPDFILCRAKVPLDEKRRNKIAVAASIYSDHIISAPDVESIYDVPVNFEREKLADKILKQLGLIPTQVGDELEEWRALVEKTHQLTRKINIGIVGKYFKTGDYILTDSYISVIEAVKHACWYNECQPNIHWLNSDEYEIQPEKLEEIRQMDCVVVPGGFGMRATEGKIKAIQFVRENNIPFLGLCFGMQMAVIEFARNVLGLKQANSSEIDPSAEHLVIDTMSEQVENIKRSNYGGTMRLGAYPCVLNEQSKSFQAYGRRKTISERHRHRYEFNNQYREQMEKAGLLFAGVSPDNRLVEIIELPEHCFFVATQFHPEFKSRPLKGHPLFNAFIRAGLARFGH